MRRRKHVIGLTGNIAAGKTTVLEMLVDLGAEGIDADALVHQMMGPDSPFADALSTEFGPAVVNPDNSINRPELGAIVFADPSALTTLEQVVHPPVVAAMKQAVEIHGPETLVLDAIKLIEAGIAHVCDEIWVTAASRETRIVRVMERNQVDRQEAERRVDAHPPQEEKVAAADLVLENDGTLEDLQRQVLSAWQRLQES